MRRAEWIVTTLFGQVDNSASWIMRNTKEYRDPVGALMERIYRGHVYGPHQRTPEVVRATAHAMLDGYIGAFS